MKKSVLPLLATAMTLSFTACQRADNVDPVAVVTSTDTNADQLLNSIATFVRTSGNAGNNPGARAAGRPTFAQIKSAFDTFDEDKSGQISGLELISFFSKVGLKITAAQVAQIIKMFDANNSGMMEFDEFERLIDLALRPAK